MKKYFNILLILLLSSTCYSQQSYWNTLLTEEEYTTIKNYNGTGIKEITVRQCKSADTTGSIARRDLFDKRGNKLKSMYFRGQIKYKEDTYEYDSLNRLIKIILVEKSTDVIDRIIYDNEGRIISFRKTDSNGNYADGKISYNKQGLVTQQSMKWFFVYILHTIRADTYETLDKAPNTDVKKFWAIFQYYSGDTPAIKGSADPAISKVYVKVNGGNQILKITKTKGSEADETISIKYDANNRISEKIIDKIEFPEKSYKEIYSYEFY